MRVIEVEVAFGGLGFRRDAGLSGSGEGREVLVAAGDAGFLPGAGPAPDLALAGDGVEEAVVGFGEDEGDRAAGLGEAGG